MTVTRRARKKAETRDRIVAAALDLFERKGIDAVTVDDISTAADVGKGTIYNYFATKEDIVVAFLVEIERQVQQEVARLRDRKGSLESTLEHFVHKQFKLKEPHHKFVRIFLAEMYGHTDRFLPWMQQLQDVIDVPLRQLFSSLAARGLLRSDLDLDDLVMVFKTVQLGLTGLWAVEGPPWRETHRLLKVEIRYFCRGVAARSSTD